MISEITGKLVSQKDQALIIQVGGFYYEVMVPASVINRVEQTQDAEGNIHLMTYHYFQLTQSSATPVLVGFIHEMERDFFLQFITVSGIGPRAAVKALNKPISEIAGAIDKGDIAYLKTLPGIGMQRAKEIVAKLQGKVGRFGLIRDESQKIKNISPVTIDWQQEALDVLLQLQYKKPEAQQMIQKALERKQDIQSAEDLLNEIYKQKVSL
ncbi:MAG TPA: OB-fold domain-containing protein [Candidatus Omnitrophota bacterium]|nr:OB-fold domain-containing protein [Candidatus Omnitrophota bacterium]HPN88815.1 OB-fold domain-containing protein [Candidatus Omnitrophota bacterium]